MWDIVLHKRLQVVCAYLWPDPRDCQRLVQDSMIDSSRISWEEPPFLRWQSVIMEADKQGTLSRLCDVLIREYPENKELKLACSPWQNGEQPLIAKKEENPVALSAKYAQYVEETPPILEAIRHDLALLSTDIAELKLWRKSISTLSATVLVDHKEPL